LNHSSDAFYIQQLFERLEGLQPSLSEKLAQDAPLRLRTSSLLNDMSLLLRQPDGTGVQMLEFSLLPKINRLLLDARQQLKLKNHAKGANKLLTRTQQRDRIVRERAKELPTPPQPPRYKATPAPIRDEERNAMIEDALTKLKTFLKEE